MFDVLKNKKKKKNTKEHIWFPTFIFVKRKHKNSVFLCFQKLFTITVLKYSNQIDPNFSNGISSISIKLSVGNQIKMIGNNSFTLVFE